MNLYNKTVQKEYKNNKDILMYLRGLNTKKRNTINDIIDNEIIKEKDKKEKIYKKLKDCKQIYENIKDKDIFKFIDLLICNKYENLHNLLINQLTIKKITKETKTEKVFKYFEIISGNYKYLWNKSDIENKYIRDKIISYE